MYVSTVTGEGVDEILSEITRLARIILSSSQSSPLLMIERHRAHLNMALSHTETAITALEQWSEEIAALELHHARDEIQRITGETMDIDVLETVFRSFCIGK